MGVIGSALLQARIWNSFLRLGSSDPAERATAMSVLEEAGAASLPSLRLGTLQTSNPIKQFGAAVLLHRLEQPEGMDLLTEALRWRLEETPALAGPLEDAFVQIGSPDAVTALLEVWQELPDWTARQLALETICRVWARLQDSRVLPSLAERAERIPEAFEVTMRAFGVNAIPFLEQMLRDKNPMRRTLAIRTLGGIPSRESFLVLEPALRDADALVRGEVPMAMEAVGGPRATADAIQAAIREGFSTHAAVTALARLKPHDFYAGPMAPDLGDTLLLLINRWERGPNSASGDTGAAVLAAIQTLARSPSQPEQLIPPLCALLSRQPGSGIAAEIARLLGDRGNCGEPTDSLVRQTLWPLLADPDADAREAGAQALARLGEPAGRQFLQLLEECRPYGNLLEKLHALLQGGPDVGQIATQAVQQMTQWVTRKSRETVERLNTGSTPGALVLRDARLAGLLQQLLSRALEALSRAALPDDIEKMLAINVAALRALGRVGAPEALVAREELLCALHFTKWSLVYEAPGQAPFRKSDMREVAEMVRAAAADVLMEFYEECSFGLLLEALYAPDAAVRVTAASALGRHGDVRGLTHLQALLAHPSTRLAAAAADGVAGIRRARPELMTLLRASAPETAPPETLLRPASGRSQDFSPDVLLRPDE